MTIKILDTTLRDGSNAINFQFDRELTQKILSDLEKGGIEWIEMGHGLGLGATKKCGNPAPLSDEEYMDLATFKKRLSWMVKKLRTSPMSEDSSGVYFPGELERLTYLKRNKEGIPITSEIWSDLKALSQKYMVKLPLKFDIKK